MKFNNIFTTMNVNLIDESNIPQRFRKEIELHIFKNYYANTHHEFKTPLILAISGPPGVGKTYQTQKILGDIGIKNVGISGSEFENEYAGIPAKNILKTYRDVADDVYYKKISYGAIIIDDIDAALGGWGDLVQYTMNRQLIIKALIDLADNPYELTVTDDEQIMHYEVCRIPIIITLNDETKMYEPLMRNGRTKTFPWIPNIDEIAYILDSLFKDTNFTDSEKPCIPVSELYVQLLEYAKNESKCNITVLPISLFSDIKSSLIDDYLWIELQSNSVDMVVTNLEKRLCTKSTYEFSKALNIGQKLLRQNKNYLNH